jgi:hypothetical protein
MSGVLKPFVISLFNGQVADIIFEKGTFRSVNGGAPNFDLKIQDVTLGPMLKFIEPLQAWLAPAGSGFYIRPQFSPGPQLEAGYVFDAGVIQVGSLQFINVTFAIAAYLPFDDRPAQFEFRLADESRPFLIASPPYGGGGYFSMLSDTEVRRISMSFVFGGVTAIKFGPLNAQGRVVTGVGVDLIRTPGGRSSTVIKAIVEAVGEGSIACFGICVFIRVALIHTDGILYGESQYRFTFRVGFATFGYGFTARYRVAGGSKTQRSQVAALAGRGWDCSAAPRPDDRVIVTKTPLKASQWRAYSDRMAMELLDS